MARRLLIRWGPAEKVVARLELPDVDRGVGVLVAHGAGAGQDHPFMATLRRELARCGIAAMTFNYAFTEAGRKAPDRLPKLLEVHRAAADRMTDYFTTIYLGGKSMGGRVASHLVGDYGWPAAGLVYYGYPLVPLGKREPRDTTHLAAIRVPQLFFAGSRDRLSPPDLIEPLAGRLAAASAQVVPDADHSFNVPKRTGLTHTQVIADLAARTADWAQPRPS